MNDFQFLKAFFQSVVDEALEANDERYVPLYEAPTLLPDDPVERLYLAIRFSKGQSVQLLSGFRGTGKTTELRRLESRLIREGYKVVYVNMDDYLSPSVPIDISDFLMALAGAFGEALEAPENLGKDTIRESAWERFSAFLTRTKITLPEASASGIKANLKSDPTFRQVLQQHMEGHLGALLADVRKFFEERVKALKARHGAETEVVFLVDSVEHLRGSYLNARQVQESVELVFAGHAEKLRLPYLHVIYTVPPYLKARSMNLGQLYPYGAVQVFPAVKVRDHEGIVHHVGVEALVRIVEKRGDFMRLLGDKRLLEKIILTSGGNIRDLLRLLSEIILRARTLPVEERVVDDAINQMRTEFLPIPENDAVWLARIAREHEAALEDLDGLPALTRFFDTHAVLCYRNGPEWYDVHPLIKDIVLKQADAIAERRHAAEGVGVEGPEAPGSRRGA